MPKPISGKAVAERIRNRMGWIQDNAKDTVGGALQLQLLHWQQETGEYVFRSATTDWMRNVIGTLHGGSCAIMVDQAMGCVANCLY
jgi:acyl-coenzyme A thioesterase PaaI-like protein